MLTIFRPFNARQRLSVVALTILAATTAEAELDLRNATVSQMANGLTVILLEDRNFPVASVQMLYRVGARDETNGKTGLAHFLEHMAFRGTRDFPDTGPVSSIYARGGEWHGYTWTDETTYFATVPKQHLDLLLRIEADRMARLVIDPDAMEAERGAVLAEMHMYENDPTSMLIDAVMYASFLGHPYRNNTIGWESDIQNLQHADVVSFYRAHYHPSNAVLAVVGDIDAKTTMDRIDELFAGLAEKTPTALPVTIEPPQNGERRVLLRGHGDSRQFMIAYRAPSASHADFAAFLVLQELLGGGSGVSFLQNDWGTAVRNESLLAGAADGMTTWFPPSAQDYIFVLGGSAKSDSGEAETEQEIERRVATTRTHPVNATTLSSAISRLNDQLTYDVETTEDAAHQLAYFAGLGALDTLLSLPERVAAVTSSDVQRVASNWLLPELRTIAWHLPYVEPAKPVAAIQGTRQTRSNVLRPMADIDTRPVPAPVTHTLKNGVPVIIQASDFSSSVVMQIVFATNEIEGQDVRRNSPVTGRSSIIIRGRSGTRLAEELWSATESAVFVEAGPAVESRDPETRLEQTFVRYMNPGDAVLQNAANPELIVVSGDVETEEVVAVLEQRFGLLAPGSTSISRQDTIDHGEISVSLRIPVPQAQLGYLVSAPAPQETQYDAFRILQYILAHGYEGRLGKEAISRRGLAYYIDSRYRSDGTNGWISLGIGVDPLKIESLRLLLQTELQRLSDEPPTAAEVDEAKNYFLGRADSAAQSNTELADSLAREWLWRGEAGNRSGLERRLTGVTRRDVLAALPAFINGLTIVVAE